MTMITPSYLGETIEYSSLHACRSTLEDPTKKALGVDNPCAKLKGTGAWTDPRTPISSPILPQITICADNALPCSGKQGKQVKNGFGSFNGVYKVPCQSLSDVNTLAGIILHEMIHGTGLEGPTRNPGSPLSGPELKVEQATQAIACCAMQAFSGVGNLSYNDIL